MQQRAQIVTAWTVVDGANVPYVPPLPAGSSWMDSTGQDAASLLPDPNTVVLEVWTDAAGIAALDGDAAITVLSVWEEPDATP